MIWWALITATKRGLADERNQSQSTSSHWWKRVTAKIFSAKTATPGAQARTAKAAAKDANAPKR
jgi:hypothetical protein